MPNLNPKTCSNPELLRKIRPDLLLAWLKPAASYLEPQGVLLHFIDYDKLARLFLEPPPDLPPDLAESLFLIHEMANPAGMDFILERAEANGLNLGLGEDVTPADVAVQAWLLDRRLLADLHNCQELTR